MIQVKFRKYLYNDKYIINCQLLLLMSLLLLLLLLLLPCETSHVSGVVSVVFCHHICILLLFWQWIYYCDTRVFAY